MGLLTSLKNFLHQIKWKKKHTKQSEISQLQQSEEQAALKDVPDNIKEYLQKLDTLVEKMQTQFVNNISYMNLDKEQDKVETINVLTNQDAILDFVNNLPEALKTRTLKALSNSEKEIAIFLTAQDDNDEKIYVTLLNILKDGPVKGLMLFSSTSQVALSAVLAEISNLSEDKIIESFNKGETLNDLGEPLNPQDPQK